MHYLKKKIKKKKQRGEDSKQSNCFQYIYSIHDCNPSPAPVLYRFYLILLNWVSLSKFDNSFLLLNWALVKLLKDAF